MRQDIQRAIQTLQRGGVVLFPTETAYGLAADARNPRAVRRVFEIKGREPEKTPSLIVSDEAMAREYVQIDPILDPLVAKHWPGPLTVVGKIGRGLARDVVRKDGTVAVRVSSHPIARALAKGLDAPIVATSANVSGLSACYSVNTFHRQRSAAKHPEPDAVIDIGPLPYRKASTIVVFKKGKLVVLRQGTVKI